METVIIVTRWRLDDAGEWRLLNWDRGPAYAAPGNSSIVQIQQEVELLRPPTPPKA